MRRRAEFCSGEFHQKVILFHGCRSSPPFFLPDMLPYNAFMTELPSTESESVLEPTEGQGEHNYALYLAILVALVAAVLAVFLAIRPKPPEPLLHSERVGKTSIAVAGRYVDIGTPVVLWTDEGGYNAYNRGYHFEESLTHPSRLENGEDSLRFGSRPFMKDVDPNDPDAVLAALQEDVDIFLIHYDACGVSRQCFKILHDIRGLSVHFMLDVDGTIYQTLDLTERAWHGSQANDRSIGIEIANIGAYGSLDTLNEWYGEDDEGPYLTPPAWMKTLDIRTPDFVARPARPDLVEGVIHGKNYYQYDFTEEQYAALIKLTAGLNRVFPKIHLEAPRDAEGRVVAGRLSDEEEEAFEGLLAHWHISLGKRDPGPAFDWDRVLNGARALVK